MTPGRCTEPFEHHTLLSQQKAPERRRRTTPWRSLAAAWPLLAFLFSWHSRTTSPPRRLPVLVLSIAGLVAQTATAEPSEEVRQFDIEVLIFRNLVKNDGGEIWPVDYADWIEDPVDSEQPAVLVEEAVTWLPKSQFRLTAQRNALARSAPYRPIAHLAWRQAVLDRRQARPVALPRSPGQPDQAYVDGMVRVAVARYLHLELDLRLHLPAIDGQEAESVEYGVANIRLREQRRMRSKELHFFDHPRFGVIALITPYQAAPDSQAEDRPAAAQP